MKASKVSLSYGLTVRSKRTASKFCGGFADLPSPTGVEGRLLSLPPDKLCKLGIGVFTFVGVIVLLIMFIDSSRKICSLALTYF